jgi:hypothetical protein
MIISKTEQGYWLAEGSFLGRRFLIEGKSWSEAFLSAVNHMRFMAGVEEKAVA